jgi:fucose permease
MPVARWSIALFILYTGLELAIGSWAFTVLTEGRGIAAMTAAGWTGAYWAGLTGGRLLGAVVVTRLGLVALLRLATGLLMIGLALFSSGGPAPVSLIGLAVAGAAAGPVFPSLIAATPARVGTRHAANAVGFQIAGAAIGQSLVPSTLGFVASHLGLQTLVQLLVALAVALAVVNERMIRGQKPAARRPSAPASVIADAGRDVERPRRPLEGAERAVKPTR